ncbi:LEC14B homolog [Punica granatum]|uniref:LEC14B homolog n=1 Tax=Punica granatum TaxID=22663 RepID=A0A6P8EK92_PUNGR|nr:LEC14B homolog [Punica granatum]XP_031406133.1 LEC14B homolog [Punica granatum]XP_031406143.1 LEC14B homolog [Punica granatum]
MWVYRSMVRRAKNKDSCEDENSGNESQRTQESGAGSCYLDDDLAHLTKLRSGPHEHLSRAIGGRKLKLPVSPVTMLAARESNFSGRGRFSTSDSCHMLSRFLPTHGPTKLDEIRSRTYVSQFSADGSLFVAGFQRSQIRVYNVEKDWKVQKDIMAKSLRWTITDTCLSPDQRFLVYSSMSPLVHIVNIQSATTESLANITEIHDGLNFSVDDNDDEDEISIFSVKFSTDGRELVAASGDGSIYVYDLGANKLNIRITAHLSDVNTVCFADESGNLIYSGSDDKLCKVWDRRCLVSRGQAAGVLTGHLEGITYIDSRGDGRYFISNGKDQTTKLWDIRKMTSNASPQHESDWDYRWMEYPQKARKLKHANDLSLATYKGHSVLCTLIRCYFSPIYSTAQKYIYTGSSDCSVYIYDLVSGARVAMLDYHDAPVRDCSWHPIYPMLVSSSWDGVIARWDFPGDGLQPLPKPKRNHRRIIY